MLSHFIPLELFSFCLLVGLEGVSAHPSPVNRELSRRDDTVDDAPISFSRGAKIGVIVGTIFVVSMLVIWLFVRNRGAWKETDLDHGIQPPSLQEASRRQVHLERVSNIVPQPGEDLNDGRDLGEDLSTTRSAQEDWRRNPTTTLNRDGTPHIPAPAYVVPPVPPPAYTASET